MVPIIEVLGLIVLFIDIIFFSVNYEFLFIVTVFVYFFYTTITLISIFLDQLIHKQYASIKELSTLLLMVYLEPLLYHPINVYASIKGYIHFITNKEKKWGAMTRQGFINAKE
jgi:hypothetical protein